MKPTPTSRDDLPFVLRTVDGERMPWQPRRNRQSPETAVQIGFDALQAVADLAKVDEYDAYRAIQEALLAPEWNCNAGEEAGFADALARLAIVAWRAQAQGDAPRFDPTQAHWRSLHTRVELMELQLQSMKVKPWRSAEEAGLG